MHHAVGDPRHATEVVDRQGLFELDTIVLHLGVDDDLRHDQRLLDVVRDRVDVQRHAHPLLGREPERGCPERAPVFDDRDPVRDAADGAPGPRR